VPSTNECSISRRPSLPLGSGNSESSASRTVSMAEAAITTTSAASKPVTGPDAVIRTQRTPVARRAAPEAPVPASSTRVTIVSGTSRTRPVRRASRSGISAAGLATTGQPKPLQNPQSLQACWPLYGRELIAIGNGNGCRPTAAAPAATASDARCCGPGGIGNGPPRGACRSTSPGIAATSPCTPISRSTSS
jgi:hypothetical protein